MAVRSVVPSTFTIAFGPPLQRSPRMRSVSVVVVALVVTEPLTTSLPGQDRPLPPLAAVSL